jgi:hypothetical protein
MITRRNVLLGIGAGAVIVPVFSGFRSSNTEQHAARALRSRMTTGTSDRPQLMRELIRYATLAPSSHNTQCWRFQAFEKSISILPDVSRRCPAVDPDDHHLFVSLGCATENLALAALANGLQAEARLDSNGTGRIAVNLEATTRRLTPSFQAITERQCTRGEYDGHPISPTELRLLERAGTGNGVRVQMLIARPMIERVLEYVVAGNVAQVNDNAFVSELKSWIRFSAGEALSTGDGLFSGASGVPVMPRWLGSPAMSLFFTAQSENERYSKQIRSSAGIAVFVSEANDKPHWIEAGRCYERFALQATALGIRNAFLNQPVEVSSIRPQFATWLGLAPGARPDLVVRFGRGPTLPLSMRRPVQDVLV